MRRELLICVVLAGVTLGIYWPVRSHDFIDYDDPQYVTENDQAKSGLTWRSLRWAFTTPVVANWHPVTALSHALDCQLFGTRPGPQHLVNVAFHIANALLLFLVLNRMTGALWRSATVAALFALHPLRVESVAWISERKDVLSGFFFMLTLLAYSRFAESRKQKAGGEKQKAESRKQKLENGGQNQAAAVDSPLTAPRSLLFYLASLVFFALGLMSKPMLVSVPFVLLLLDWWPLQRVQIENQKPEIKNLLSLFWEKLPCFALTAFFCVITLLVQRQGSAVVSLATLSAEDRLANALLSYIRYLAKLGWPTDLAIIYPLRAGDWSGWQVAIAALVLLAISGWCLRLAARRPYLSVGWFWYLGMMVPVIGLVQVGEQAMADRYTYLPLIGPAISLVWLVADLWKPGVRRPGVMAGLALLLLVACAGFTRRQLGYWKNTVALFEHATAVTTGNSSAEFSLGVGLEKAGQVAPAMVHYRTAAALNPKDQQPPYNLGQVLRKQGRWQEAAEQYEIVLGLNPNQVPSLLNLAGVLLQLGRPAEAAARFEQALRVDPDNLQALNNFAWLLATSPQAALRSGPRAVQLAQRACELTRFEQPTMVGTLAAAYAEAGQFSQAVAAAEQARDLAAKANDAALLKKNLELLARYRAGQPYREPQPGI